MIGGELITGWGGFIYVGSDVTPTKATRLDVASWELTIENKVKPITYSGSMGSINRRILAQNWICKLQLFYDNDLVNNGGKLSYNKLIRVTDHVSLCLFVGNLGNADASINPADKIATTYAPRFRSPDGITTFSKIINKNDDVVIQEVTIEANSLMMEITNSEDQGVYANYLSKIATRLRS